MPCMGWCMKTDFMKKINIINRRVVWQWLDFRDVYLDSTYWQIVLCTYISVHKYTIHVYKWIYYSWIYTHVNILFMYTVRIAFQPPRATTIAKMITKPCQARIERRDGYRRRQFPLSRAYKGLNKKKPPSRAIFNINST